MLLFNGCKIGDAYFLGFFEHYCISFAVVPRGLWRNPMLQRFMGSKIIQEVHYGKETGSFIVEGHVNS